MMTKKVLILFLVLFFPLKFYGQEFSKIDSVQNIYFLHYPLDKSFALSGNMIMNNPYHSVFAGGFKMRVFITKHLSLDTEFLIGKNYMQLGPGIFGIPLIFLGGTNENISAGGFLVIIAVVVASFEHITYHFPLKNTTDISPYISAFRLKQLSFDDEVLNAEYGYAHPTFAAGVELNKYFKRFVVSPYIEYNITYDGFLRGFNFGINAGYYFPTKK